MSKASALSTNPTRFLPTQTFSLPGRACLQLYSHSTQAAQLARPQRMPLPPTFRHSGTKTPVPSPSVALTAPAGLALWSLYPRVFNPQSLPSTGPQGSWGLGELSVSALAVVPSGVRNPVASDKLPDQPLRLLCSSQPHHLRATKKVAQSLLETSMSWNCAEDILDVQRRGVM